jgi:hypothetical protein
MKITAAPAMAIMKDMIALFLGGLLLKEAPNN